MSFFFRASLKGYAGGGRFTKASCEDILPEKEFRFHEDFAKGTLIYVDRYVRNGELSRGDTTIYFETPVPQKPVVVPIWSMWYHGWCSEKDKEAIIAHLKDRLRCAYETRVFRGGRGKLEDRSGSPSFQYRNSFQGDFSHFNGKEFVSQNTSGTWRDVFWHEYGGILFIPASTFVDE